VLPDDDMETATAVAAAAALVERSTRSLRYREVSMRASPLQLEEM
jgi:hypothetical protein